MKAILSSLSFLSLLACFLFPINDTLAQRNCGSMEYLEQQENNDPKRAVKMQQIEAKTREYLQNEANRAVNGVITIPVVVHVVYNNSSENVSDAQIQTQIDVLNADFRRTNSDADNTWSQAADTEIEFCLATTDPNGNPTNGITRTSTSQSSFGTNDQVKFNSSGGKDAWPAGSYMNFWVCDISGGILGYAQFPGGSASTDGIVVDYQYFGTIGTATAPFNLGRTATHEVGHWLNLRHIWGDGGCSVDDFVADTPVSDASNGGCAVGHTSCGTVDMVQNYMDYSDDACMNLFTQGQKTRMRALFDNGGFRESLLNSSACGTAPPPTCDDGIQNGNETGVDCGGPDCAPCSTGCQDNLVNISITLDNYPSETSWTITNASGAVVASGGNYGSLGAGGSVNVNECLADGCYDFTINDTYGDGICCSYGNGSYSVSSGGSVLVSGGAFGSSETNNFCLGTTQPTCDDGIQNGDETGVDCGGSDCTACPTCDDGIQNGNETGVDCGGPDCAACPTCDDGIQNGNETGVDCGGPDCAACPTCDDGIQNGNETGVDCGGPDCAPCATGCQDNEVTISITLDNYPGETSWTITNANGAVVASGGNYGSLGAGGAVNVDECLADGCYDFTINDSYGDGICCSYGNGSYSISSGGSVLVSGGAFGSSETKNFCLGNSSQASCSDGIQNGDETGVDCGGSNCAPCATGCSTVNIDSNNFENGWGIWNDGGSDCRRSSNDASYANGTYCVRLRDNTSSSVMTTDVMNLSSYDEITVDFSYYARSMDNSNEDFWFQISNDGGSSYTRVEEWNRDDEFNNNERKDGSVTVAGPFTNNMRLRFRCDASSNSDWVYIDDVVISGCQNNTRTTTDDFVATQDDLIIEENVPEVSKVLLFPNPTRGMLNISFSAGLDNASVQTYITDMTGKLVAKEMWVTSMGKQQKQIDMTQFDAGIYMMHIISGETKISQKFVVIK